MSVRAKLFLLLLALAVLPILLLRVNAQRSRQDLNDDLVRRSQHLLIGKAKAHMRLIVEDHAALWRREGMFLEQTLRLQAQAVEKTLPKGDPESMARAYLVAYGRKDERLSGQITCSRTDAFPLCPKTSACHMVSMPGRPSGTS